MYLNDQIPQAIFNELHYHSQKRCKKSTLQQIVVQKMHFFIEVKVQNHYNIVEEGINMTLKELRLSKELTQSQVAKLVGISLRSYKEYENDATKINTLKYKYIFNELSKINYIDEEHGILKIDNIKKIVSDVLTNFDVDYCYLFGSYAKNNANELSDVDLLVSTKITGMAFFGLAERLRESLHKKVDLLNIEQLTNNQVLLDEILKNGIKIYDKE